MKTLNFVPELCEKIIKGEKTVTWRFFDEKDFEEGDYFEVINEETEKMIGAARVTKLDIKTFDTLGAEDKKGHEKYKSKDAMYETYREYYGKPINKDTEFKVMHFSFVQM